MKTRFLRKLVLGIAASCLLGHSKLHADTTADPVTSGVYSGSITREALLASSAENLSENPSLPSASFSGVDGKVNGSVGSESSSLSYRGDESWLSAELGLGYYNPEWGEDRIRYHLGMAAMVTDNVAVGLLGDHDSYKRDMVLNTVWQTPLDGFRLKLSGGYMWGKQDFTFSDVVHSQDLKQFSWVAAGEYIVPDGDSALGLHSLGMSAWGSRASDESGDSYVLSEGRIFGVSADTQVAILNNLVAKGSVGYEELNFPLPDAAKEKNTDLYTDLGVTWEPVKAITLDAGWKNGVSEDRYTIGAASGPVKLSSWYTRGHAGLADEKGATLAYAYNFGAAASHQHTVLLSSRLKPLRSAWATILLVEAMKRPTQMPSRFLVKSPNQQAPFFEAAYYRPFDTDGFELLLVLNVDTPITVVNNNTIVNGNTVTVDGMILKQGRLIYISYEHPGDGYHPVNSLAIPTGSWEHDGNPWDSPLGIQQVTECTVEEFTATITSYGGTTTIAGWESLSD